MTSNQFSILIADRNRYSREFLRREFEAEGYDVTVAKNARELRILVKANHCPELVILDLDMPCTRGLDLLKELQKQQPPIPVVVHTFFTQYAEHPAVKSAAGFCEKRGSRIKGLRKTVRQVLQEWYPGKSLAGYKAGARHGITKQEVSMGVSQA